MVRADGFNLDWARENQAHIVMKLSPEQITTVGRERKLILTDSQRRTLSKFTKKEPRILGVESIGEPDCGCCISSVFWTATNEVTIWIERLVDDEERNNWYYEVRHKAGYYTVDAEGQLYAAGKHLSWEQFERSVLASEDGKYIHLSLPPEGPEDFTARVKQLKTKNPYFRTKL